MSPSLKFFLMAQSAWLQNEVCRQFVLGDVPATIPVENLSAAIALRVKSAGLPLRQPLPVSGHRQTGRVGPIGA